MRGRVKWRIKKQTFVQLGFKTNIYEANGDRQIVTRSLENVSLGICLQKRNQ